MVKYIWILFFTALHSSALAQWDSLLHQPYNIKIAGLYKWYSANHKSEDTIECAKKITTFRDFAIKNNDRELELEADFAKALSYNYEIYQQPLKYILLLQDLLPKASKIDYEIIHPKIYRRIGEIYWYSLRDYEHAFENFHLMLEAQTKYSDLECTEKAQNFSTIGEAYFFFKDYNSCKKNMLDVLKCSPSYFGDKSKNKARNALGLCYQVQGVYDSADYYYTQIVNSTEIFKLAEWKGIAKGNLGYSKLLQKKYSDAIPLLQENIAISLGTDDSSLLINLYSRLSTCFAKIGKYADADTALLRASAFYKEKYYSRSADLYYAYTQFYLASGNNQKAQENLEKYLVSKDSLNNLFDASLLLRVNQKLENQRNAKYINERNLKRLERNFLLILLAVLLGISIYAYFSQRKKYFQKNLIESLRLKETNEALQKARENLEQFALNISDKNKIVEQLEEKLGNKVDEASMIQLQQSTILTDQDWENFRITFEKVHQGFLLRLKATFPDLSPAEIRYMALIRLGLSNKEMASAQGISTQTVRVTRHRVLKKINLPEDSNLEDLIKNI